MKFRQVKLETIAGQRSPLWCFGGPGPCGSCTRSAGGLTHGLLAAYAAALLAISASTNASVVASQPFCCSQHVAT